jgi:hypothetical protein
MGKVWNQLKGNFYTLGFKCRPDHVHGCDVLSEVVGKLPDVLILEVGAVEGDAFDFVLELVIVEPKELFQL